MMLFPVINKGFEGIKCSVSRLNLRNDPRRLWRVDNQRNVTTSLWLRAGLSRQALPNDRRAMTNTLEARYLLYAIFPDG